MQGTSNDWFLYEMQYWTEMGERVSVAILSYLKINIKITENLYFITVQQLI